MKFWLLIVFNILAALPAFAQGCAMCTKTASDLGPKSAQGLNMGILYLAAIPLILIIGSGYYWYKRNKANL